ncbi:MAG: S8 family serine peptidase [Afipia sp.]|nr:S8 family serine peptidase [Afipia sp.]
MSDTGQGRWRGFRASQCVRGVRVAAAAALISGLVASSPVQAQSLNNFNMRAPNMNVGPRISVNPTVRYSPNIRYDGYGAVPPRVVREFEPGGPNAGNGAPPRASRKTAAAAADRSYVAKEVLIEIDGAPSDAQLDGIARRHRLTRVQSQSVPLTNSTFFRWRIPDNRPVDSVVRGLVAAGDVKSAQRNNIFRLQQVAAPQAAGKTEGDPAQYALARMHLREAHDLSVGTDVTVAVIDSGIDRSHPDLAGSIAATFDPLNSNEAPHAHGTGIAGIIVAHGRLMGAAPSARLLAIRAFGAQRNGAESTSFTVLRSLDYAVTGNAQVINMSFAGPQDAAIGRGLAAAAAKGIVLVAAAGNAGPKSAPLYPAADRNVIAVTATDASDRLFAQSNRGGYVAVSAPGVDILAPAPGGKYQVSSGTSMAAAYVSGVAALMIARDPGISPADLRATLAATARDLGPKGRDDEFGAGQVDAFSAVSAVAPVPMAAASDRSAKP